LSIARPFPHADRYAVLGNRANDFSAGELLALVRFHDLRFRSAQRILQSLNAEVRIRAVGHSPAQHMMAIPVHNGHEKRFTRDATDDNSPTSILQCFLFRLIELTQFPVLHGVIAPKGTKSELRRKHCDGATYASELCSR
jgi:hypothetical protein